MRLILTLALLLAYSSLYSQKNPQIKLNKGNWIAELALNDADKLPFNFVITKSNGAYRFAVENGEEMIQLNDPVQKGDSLYVRFPFFNSELVFTADSKKAISGYWINYNKGPHYKIPFHSKKQRSSRFSSAPKKIIDTTVVNGKWEVTFEPKTNSAYPAVGLFNQVEGKSVVSGTFLTETGDYRFLEGNVVNDSLYLSCFDGSHAFLFKAAINGDSLDGQFFSGKHWKSNWIAKKNEAFELKSPDELTYLVDNQEVDFQLKDLNGNDYHFPNEHTDGKVVIIQIMGTWCPNCLDETHYYKELYDAYHHRGLEIISIGYETGETFENYVNNISRLRTQLDLDFTFIVGGEAKKGLASEHFSMLNKVISFPTSIFIGRDGEVKRIHTGFNGPGTGEYYHEYVENTNSLIENLLAH